MGSCSHFFFFFLPTLIYQLSRLLPKTCLPLRPFFLCASETGESPPSETRAASISRACLESRQRRNKPLHPSPRGPSVLGEHVYPQSVYFRRTEITESIKLLEKSRNWRGKIQANVHILKNNQTSHPSLVKVVSSGTDVRSVDAHKEPSRESDRVLPQQRELCGGADITPRGKSQQVSHPLT